MNTAPSTALNCLRRETGGHSDRQLLDAFTAANDQSAFAALVKRHGSLVLGVCRRILQESHDAEDAFQAVFLVLARKAATLRNSEALTSWLHGVAYRVSLRARRDAARRRKHESRVVPRTNPPAWEVGWRELQAVLDEEVEWLPSAYRAAFVSCCLEGLSMAEAAAHLGIKAKTVSSRVTRARQRLQERLARRGISLTTLLAVAGASRAAVPPQRRSQVSPREHSPSQKERHRPC
jgi:RNA polymerase sigma factor (sigma-70 family)